MTATWLALSAILAFFTLATVWARRPTAARAASGAALPAAIVAAWFALQQPLGEPAGAPKPGEYAVLGARIDVDVAIYVLLDGPQPRYHKLPYTKEAAEQLQRATDAGNGVVMDVQEGGELDFGAPPSTDEPKRPERPALTIGE
jgi:hypothetical protein